MDIHELNILQTCSIDECPRKCRSYHEHPRNFIKNSTDILSQNYYSVQVLSRRKDSVILQQNMQV